MKSEHPRIPRAYFSEKADAYELKILLPGVAKEDASIHIEDRTLTLHAKATYALPQGYQVAAQEFEPTTYAMSLDLPDLVDPSTLAASLDQGILRVTMKRRPESLARQITIA